MTGQELDTYLKYTTVKGYFWQDDPLTNPDTFNYTQTNLGLIDRPYDSDPSLEGHNLSQWQRFARHLESLNQRAETGTRYILAYMARHGEGWHNRAERKYGTKAWDCYWSTLDGDGEIVWTDAHLTEVGISQALTANAFWKKEVAEQSILTPEKFFTSPLDRCLRTAQLTWSGIDLPAEHPFIPEVKEMLRECIGIHTCDRRSSKTYIKSTYSFPIEPGFAEEDPLWLPDLRESRTALTFRLKHFLDDVFKHNQNGVFSFSAHSGAIDAMLRAVSHREFALQTGSIIPVLIKAEVLSGKEPEYPVDPWEPKPEC